MPVPIYLQAGTVLIYGIGDYTGVSGISPSDPNVFKLGMIYQSWDNTMIGQSVLFRESDISCMLAYDDYPYTIIQQTRLVATEIPTY